jgi:hypothetical protein
MRRDNTVRDAEDSIAALNDRLRRDWRSPRDDRVRGACDGARLVIDFIGRTFGDQIGDVLRADLCADPDYVAALGRTSGALEQFESDLIAIGKGGEREDLVDKLTGHAADLRRELSDAIDAFIAVARSRDISDRELGAKRDNAVRDARRIKVELHARDNLDRSEQALADSERVQKQALAEGERIREDAQRAGAKLAVGLGGVEEAAGDLGSETAGQLYSEYADGETKTANTLRRGVGALLFFLAAAVVVLNELLGDPSLGHELVRLSATVPIAVLAGYLARESSHHRDSARRSREVAIAMHTLTAYSQPLGKQGRELRQALGMRVFGTGTGIDRPPVPGPGLYDDLLKGVEKAEGVVKGMRETIEKRVVG